MKNHNNALPPGLLPPVIAKFHDDEERALYELVESEAFLPSGIGGARKHELQKEAQSMFSEKQSKKGRYAQRFFPSCSDRRGRFIEAMT